MLRQITWAVSRRIRLKITNVSVVCDTVVGMLEDLWIAELKVQVVNTPMRNLFGAYIHSHKVILLSDALAPIQRRSTLLHELGHAFYGHTDTTARNEIEASEWAARQLIPGCEFERLTKIYDEPVSIASELGVLPRDVANFSLWIDRMAMKV